MTCAQVEQALLDEALLRGEGFEAHLRSCEGCGALAAAHRDALRLRGATLAPARRRPLGEVQRRAGLVGGLVLALVGSVGWLQLEFGGDPAPARVPAQAIVEEVPAPEWAVMPVNAEPSLFALAMLQATVAADTARDPREDEAAVRAFGSLPAWTAPTRTHPLRSLGRVASPVVFTTEDSP